ncbi:hypothetical protein IMZ48_17895 [Candidatus Bathyarchaeota archaeon]|nr:hypothetical protein [Candidatus Bathyarchaeota archaeon]
MASLATTEQNNLVHPPPASVLATAPFPASSIFQPRTAQMVSPSDSKLAELHQAVDLFLEETSTTPGDVDDLFRSLRFQPRTAPVSEILPADEVDQRLALAARVRGDNAMRRAIDVAILMTIPLDTLRGAASESHYQISFSDIQDFVRKSKLRA